MQELRDTPSNTSRRTESGQVEETIHLYSELLGSLHKYVSDLEDAISPICAPSGPDEQLTENTSMYSVPMAARLESYNQELSAQIKRIADMRSRASL